MRAPAAIRTVVLVALGLAVGVTGAYATHREPRLFAVAGGAACDDSVAVGYDVAYRASGRGYAVTRVLVSDIAPGCAGGPIAASLADSAGSSIPGAEAIGVVSSGTASLELASPVPAALVGDVSITLAGKQTNTTPADTGSPSPPAHGNVPAPSAPLRCWPGRRFASARVGTGGRDCLRGDARANILIGFGGNDVLLGLGGPDWLLGGPGADRLLAGSGNDRVTGGWGRDVIEGGLGDDALYGGAERDVLRGGRGDDRLEGNGSDDTLLGGPGDDFLVDRKGHDRMNGGPGRDICISYGGGDTFVGCERVIRR